MEPLVGARNVRKLPGMQLEKIIKWSTFNIIPVQVGNYIQPLWETVEPVEGGNHLYNGAVEACTTLTGNLKVADILT